jgi:hypothetical protein
MRPRSELQALLAVQIIATGFAALRFLRQSHRHMTDDYINVYGGYAIKLLRLAAVCTVGQACTSAGGVTPSAGGSRRLSRRNSPDFFQAVFKMIMQARC